MQFRRTTIPGQYVQSLAWDGDELVDWIAGVRYRLDGAYERFNANRRYRFDSVTAVGSHAVKYEAFGTKGALLDTTGRTIREIDRSYVDAEAYWYPVVLFRAFDGRILLAHCPRGYDVIDIEELDGTCLTPRPPKTAKAIYHSRLEASLDGRWLLSNGWEWAPASDAYVYDVARALEEPAYLSTRGEKIDFGDQWDGEVEGATFVGERLVCVTAEELPPSLSVFDLRTRSLERSMKLDEPAGTRLMAMGDDHVVLFDGHLRVLALSSGKVVARWDDLDGGRSIHQPSANMKPLEPPCLAPDPANARFALGCEDRIVVVSAM